MTITNSSKAMLLSMSLLLLSHGCKRMISASDRYDLVISNGRVMDPESSLDDIRNVGICDGKVCALTRSPLQGHTTIDATGMVVSPGFIDLHEHAQQLRSYAFQAHDGVTTSLELESGTDDVEKWYSERAGKSLINYGVSIGESLVRMNVMAKTADRTPLQEDEASHRAPTPEEQARILDLLTEGLHQGALAVGYDITDTPGASRWEIYDSFKLSAQYEAMNDVHMRFLGVVEPRSAFEALQELIADAISTGASLNVVHITSMGLRDTPQLLEIIKRARTRGVDISTECYPYNAASGPLNTALFDPGWNKRMGISYNDLQSVESGERLTAENFDSYRKQGISVVIYLIPEEIVRQTVADPTVIIASDGGPITGPKIHPRGQGTYSRVLGHYVREEKALTLMDALRKMTLMPAQRLEKRAPLFRSKGRIRIGADADIAVFDPERIIDKATYDDPLQYSEGVQFVLVHGVPVVRNGELLNSVMPGLPVRAPTK
jgi:N-acyl-D-aspartate/D-glutamate deacylase